MNSPSANEPRLREHPVSRFEGDVHFFDLNTAAQNLNEELHSSTRGHRQIALYHYGSVTQVLFAFDEGGGLEEHSANGVVSIHVLNGRLAVSAGGEDHELQSGQVLMLAPGVRHDVRALESSNMLLTVHLHGAKHDDAPRRTENE